MICTAQILIGDVLDRLRELPDGSVHMVVTSPPYWGLRDYGVEGQIGLEATPESYVARMVEVFGEVRRVLRDDGTIWLNLGDSYWGGGNYRGTNEATLSDKQRSNRGATGMNAIGRIDVPPTCRIPTNGAKSKDLVGIPWLVAFALRADGWYLRSDIIWHKPNPMPESVTDRPTKAHEYVFLLSKNARYYYDAEAIKEPAQYFGPNGSEKSAKAEALGYGGLRFGKKIGPNSRIHVTRTPDGAPPQNRMPPIGGIKHVGNGNPTYSGNQPEWQYDRNKRSVWTIATQPFSEAHFATFPEDLVEPCIKAGCPIDGTVLDPFCGSGTTLLVARKLGRNSIGIELNPEYAKMARKRIDAYAPLFI